jgi:hypothetical protein
MAQWVEVNLSAILPAPLDPNNPASLFAVIKTTLELARIPINISLTALNIAKTFLMALPTIDPVKILRGMIEKFKTDFMGSGFYLCDMWDYPIKQLAIKGHGPTSTFGYIDITGGKFHDTFVTDLAVSFDDIPDTNRPQFSGSCGMIVIVLGSAHIDDLRLFAEEGSLGETWAGLAQDIRGTALAVNEIRYRAAFAKILAAAELNQFQEKTASRMFRAQNAFRLFSQMSKEERAILHIPTNSVTGERFFEDQDPKDIDWDRDIAPMMDEIESFVLVPKYPDWTRTTLKEIFPELVVVVDTLLDSVLDLLQAGTNIVEEIINIINVITSKLEEFDAVIAMIDQFVEMIEQFLDTTGFYGIWLTTGNGVSDLKKQLLESTGGPITTSGFFSGMAILAGGDAMKPLEMLFSPIVS